DAWWSLLYEEVQDSRGLSSLNAKDLQTAYIRVFIRRRLDANATRPERAPAWLYCCVESEGNVGRQPEAAAFFHYSGGACRGVREVGAVGGAIDYPTTNAGIVWRAVGAVCLAIDKVLVEKVVDSGVEGHGRRRTERATQMEQGVGLGVLAQRVVDRLVGGVGSVAVGQVFVFGSEARPLAMVFGLHPQVQAISGLPVQLGVGQVFRSVGQGLALVVATLLFAVGVR